MSELLAFMKLWADKSGFKLPCTAQSFLPPLGEFSGVCLPPVSSNPSSAEEDHRGSSVGSANCTTLAEETLVPSAPVPPRRAAPRSSEQTGCGFPASVEESSPAPYSSSLDCLAAIGGRSSVRRVVCEGG